MSGKQMNYLQTGEWKDACAEVERLVFDLPGFRSCSIRHRKDETGGTIRAVFRHVIVQNQTMLQLTLKEGTSAHTSNLKGRSARRTLREHLARAAEAHVLSDHVDLHLRITRKNRLLLSRSKPLARKTTRPAEHDRSKRYLLESLDARPLLRALGFADSQDRLRPSMQAKYRQVNEFLRILEATLDGAIPREDRPLRILDAGCGKAWLTLTAHFFLTQSRSLSVELTGVDLREDTTRAAREMAARLQLEPPQADFAVADLASYKPENPPDIVMSLHACDTATDEAMARAVEWESRVILCAPCCQHQIQSQLKPTGEQRALLRHGILRERLADLLADALRAQLLRVLGYRVRVVEFVDPAATGRNIMIRAERGLRPGMAEAVAEYKELCQAWGVVPPLQTRLQKHVSEYIN